MVNLSNTFWARWFFFIFLPRRNELRTAPRTSNILCFNLFVLNPSSFVQIAAIIDVDEDCNVAPRSRNKPEWHGNICYLQTHSRPERLLAWPQGLVLEQSPLIQLHKQSIKSPWQRVNQSEIYSEFIIKLFHIAWAQPSIKVDTQTHLKWCHT